MAATALEDAPAIPQSVVTAMGTWTGAQSVSVRPPGLSCFHLFVFVFFACFFVWLFVGLFVCLCVLVGSW